jgi:hypothetical protein
MATGTQPPLKVLLEDSNPALRDLNDGRGFTLGAKPL